MFYSIHYIQSIISLYNQYEIINKIFYVLLICTVSLPSSFFEIYFIQNIVSIFSIQHNDLVYTYIAKWLP